MVVYFIYSAGARLVYYSFCKGMYCEREYKKPSAENPLLTELFNHVQSTTSIYGQTIALSSPRPQTAHCQ